MLSLTDRHTQAGEGLVKLLFESQGLEEERSIGCQFCKRRSDAFISPGRASFHVLSFQFYCHPIETAHRTEIKYAYVLIYQFVQGKIECGKAGVGFFSATCCLNNSQGVQCRMELFIYSFSSSQNTGL